MAHVPLGTMVQNFLRMFFFYIECYSTLIRDLNLCSESRGESRLQVFVIENFLLFYTFLKDICPSFSEVIDTLVWNILAILQGQDGSPCLHALSPAPDGCRRFSTQCNRCWPLGVPSLTYLFMEWELSPCNGLAL